MDVFAEEARRRIAEFSQQNLVRSLPAGTGAAPACRGPAQQILQPCVPAAPPDVSWQEHIELDEKACISNER